MKITVLASGSKGNCTYLETEEAKIIIDCGISFRQVKNRLDQNDIEVSEVDAILVTHEHSDHVSGIPSFLGKINTNIHLSSKAYGKMHQNVKNGIPIDSIKYLDGEFKIKDLNIKPIKTSHDSADPYGFIFENKDKKVVHITDTGYLPERMWNEIKDADAYVFESNYDPELLLQSRRPMFLKQRIFGNRGHLSNMESAHILKNVIGDKTKHIIFVHLSQECNTPHDAKEIHKVEIPNYHELNVQYSCQDFPTKVIEV